MHNKLFSKTNKRGLAAGLLTCVSLLAAVAPGRAAPARNEQAPDWLHSLANVALPKYPDDTDAVVLFRDETDSIDPNGGVVEHVRIAYKILRSGGRDRGIRGLESDSRSKILSMSGWCVASNGQTFQVSEKDSVELSDFPEGGGYQDLRVKVLKIPASDPGNIVGFDFEVHKQLDLLQEGWDFQGDDPVRDARYTLQVPPGWEYKIRWTHHDEIPAQQDGANQWHWEVRNVPAVDKEKDMPPEESVEGRAVIDFFPTDPAIRQKTLDSWAQFGLWYDRLAAGRRNDSPDIAAKVRELTAQAPTTLDKMRAIADWMQGQIRYYEIQIGIGGYQPHPASWVFANRYGDCKDKATLMSTMLKDVGIDSYYVIINAERGVVGPDDPPWNGFDHVILAIRVPTGTPTGELYATYQDPKLGTLLFFDPTNPDVPLGYIPTYLQANYGMLVADDGGELVELPLLPPQTNRLIRAAKFVLDPDGSLRGVAREIRWGALATDRREEIHYSTKANPVDAVLESYISKFVPGAVLNQSAVQDLDDKSQTLILDYSFTAKGYAQNAGDLLLVRTRVMGEAGNTVLEDTTKLRKYPVALRATEAISDSFEIAIPPGYVVDELPPPTNADYPFASYVSKVESDGKVLHYTRTYQVKSVVVPMERLADLKKFYEQVAQDENNSVVLKRAAK
jgi:transglutaminase-like putative cysteine protease